MSIQAFEESVLAKIDQQVASASDDQLFAGGYLIGHVSLSAAQCMEEGTDDVKALINMVSDSLRHAKSELSPSDYEIVLGLWQSLTATG
ncbi:YfcL family protein [Thaumasiovibrio subtropicus]|uniref:YfcL family protein n=1 Tax=Thaumasiovibrio subtropicus TaxID=1891207 RepID=UPI000B36364B|nr:YfcL family protein [Thaumasiovibrio subtropicus]